MTPNICVFLANLGAIAPNLCAIAPRFARNTQTLGVTFKIGLFFFQLVCLKNILP